MSDSQQLPRLSATYDPEAKALYIHVRETRIGAGLVVSSEDDGLIWDRTRAGELVGIEVLLTEPLEILTDPSTANSSPIPVIEVRADA